MKTITLNGQWNLQFLQASYPVQIPGSVLSALLDAEAIPDPYDRINEYATRDIFWNDFSFFREFALDEEDLQQDFLELVCHGIDTIADLFLNGQLLGSTENMHRTYRFDLKGKVQAGQNALEVRIYSPLRYMKEAEEAVVEKFGRGIKTVPAGGIKGNQYLRKAHSMMGWDWGAQLPDAGIWRDIEIVCGSQARIVDVAFRQIHHMDGEMAGHVTLFTKVFLDAAPDQRFKLSLQLTHAYSGMKRVLATQSLTKTALVNPGVTELELSFDIAEPKLWWPNQLGEQNLYEVSLALKGVGLPGGGAAAVAINKIPALDSRTYTIGLRTIEVCQNADEWGKEFCFRVNGSKIFAMGANYIPDDCVYSRITRERLEQMLQNAVLANYNMVRVWGGGYYPSNDFYDLCDKMGLLVWQDLMYACNVYYLSDAFAENVKAETIDNVRRLRHHASLALWCGNNEMESAWAYWGWSNDEPTLFKADYVKLFEYLIPEIMKKEDPDTFYWPSSPSSGGCFDNPSDENRGDAHYWDVWHGQKPFTDYEKYFFRFCSEFGFQSFPCIKTVESFTEESDRNIFSRVMESHQKNDSANGKMLYYLSENFRYPKDFASLLYVTQVLQGIAVKSGIDHWRRNRGRCMGTLYWQLNDNWPVASWSSVDYYGRWKALHYMVKRSFAPQSLSLQILNHSAETTSGMSDAMTCLTASEKNGAKAYICNESFQVVHAKVTIRLRNMQLDILDEQTEVLQVPAFGTASTKEVVFAKQRSGEVNGDTVFVEACAEIGQVGECLTEAAPLVPYKYLELPEATVKASAFEETEDAFQFIVSSTSFAPYVTFELAGADAIFSDNAFCLSGREPKTIRIEKKHIFRGEIASAADLEQQLQIMSIRQTY